MRHVNLSRRLGSRGTRGEKGAAAVIVTALLGGGVLLGFAALSIDVGSIMWERRQLQNGADASALALAGVCAKNDAACSTTVATTRNMLTALNNANAADQASTFDASMYGAPSGGLAGVCGSGVAGMQSCNPPTGGLADCTVLPAHLQKTPPVPYVEVHTLTQTTSGATLLPKWISQTIAGSAPGSGTRVAACARAAWGPAAPTNVPVLPIVVSYCEWSDQTGYTPATGAVYPAAPDYGQYPNSSPGYPAGYGPNNPTPVSSEQVVYTKSADASGTCQTWKNGSSAPGGFYSISDSSSSCTSSSVDSGGWVNGKPGNDIPCSTFSSLVGKVVYIPIFDCLRPTASGGPGDGLDCTGTSPKASGNNTNYHIAGYAAFYLTGGYFSSTPISSIASGSVPCSGSERCISGWFIKDLVPEGDIQAPDPNGPPNMGLNVVKAAG